MKTTVVTIEQKRLTQVQIAEYAYQIRLERGTQPGHEFDGGGQRTHRCRSLPLSRQLIKLIEMSKPVEVADETY